MWVSGEERLRRRDEPVQRPWGRRAGAARGSATEQRTGSRAGAWGGTGTGPCVSSGFCSVRDAASPSDVL